MVAYKQHMALAGVPFSSEQLLQLMMHKNIMKDKGLHKQILNSISFNFFEKKTPENLETIISRTSSSCRNLVHKNIQVWLKHT